MQETGVAQRQRAGLITLRSLDRNGLPVSFNSRVYKNPPRCHHRQQHFTGMAQRKRAGLIIPRSLVRIQFPVFIILRVYKNLPRCHYSNTLQTDMAQWLARGAHNSEDLGSKPSVGIFLFVIRVTHFPVSHSFPVFPLPLDGVYRKEYTPCISRQMAGL